MGLEALPNIGLRKWERSVREVNIEHRSLANILYI